MHPTRWGDPAAATALPDAARGLIEMAFGIDERPAVAEVTLPASGHRRRTARRAPRTCSAPSTCSPTTRPDGCAPAASRPPTCSGARGRPDRRPRRRRPARRPTTRSPRSSPIAVEHHLAVVPFGGGTSVTGGLVARREGYAGLLSLDLIRMKRLLAVDHVSMTATLEPGLRGPEAEALLAERGPDARPLPAVLRVRHDRRLRGHPVQRPVERRLRPLRRAGRRPARSPRRAAELDLGSAPANAAGPDLRQLILGSEGAFGVITAVTVRVRRLPAEQGLRGLALAVLRRRRRRDAHARAGRPAAHGASGSPTSPRPRSTWPAPTRSAPRAPAAA